MSETTVRVKFRATPENRTWKHRRGGIEKNSAYGNTQTTRIRPRVILEDGDVAEMTDWETQWCLNHFPKNFEVVTRPVDPRSPSFDLEACSYPQLQNAARTLGLNPSGKMDDLKDRIRAKLQIPKKTKTGNGDE